MAGPSYAQISTPCNPSTITTVFTPCMSFLTNSSANGTSPTTQCCTALKSLTSSGMDCLCLIVTASVPFKIPINRTLAVSLPRACNMPGVPVQCKGKKKKTSIIFFCLCSKLYYILMCYLFLILQPQLHHFLLLVNPKCKISISISIIIHKNKIVT
jgi:hypothetical protein